LDYKVYDIKLDEIKAKQEIHEKIMQDTTEHINTLDEFNTLYCDLARSSRLDEQGEIKIFHNEIIKDWELLNQRTVDIMKDLVRNLTTFEEFVGLQEREMVWLRQLHTELTQLDISPTNSMNERSKKLKDIQLRLEQRAANIENVSQQAINLETQLHPQDYSLVENYVQNLGQLNEDVNTLLNKLLKNLQVKGEELCKVPLKLKIHKATKLQKKGFFGKPDPYTLIKYGDLSIRTDTIKNNLNPEWEFSTVIVSHKKKSKTLTLQVFDEDVGKDDPLGHAEIDIESIVKDNVKIVNKWIKLDQCKSGEILISIEVDSETGKPSTPSIEIDQHNAEDNQRFEQDKSVQADTLSLPIPDSGICVTSNINTPDDFLPDLERDDDTKKVKSEDELLSILERSISECKHDIENLETSLDITEDYQHLLLELSKCKASLELCQHYNQELSTRFKEQKYVGEVKNLNDCVLDLESRVSQKSGGTEEDKSVGAAGRQQTSLNLPRPQRGEEPEDKSGSVSPGATCPLCRRRNWKQLEADLWRLEKWLNHAHASLQQLLNQGVPTSIEELEDVIQDHREFLLDLDSHKSVAMSINVVGCHLADHTGTPSKAESMRERLAQVNVQWDSVCEQAALWQTRLQTALLENGEFHNTIQELQTWLDATTARVKEAEPVDLSVSRAVLQAKYTQFLELQKDLQRCEPRIVSLQEAADQLELQADSQACKQVKKKLAMLSRSLRGLIQVCGIYLSNLARTLGLPPPPQAPEGALFDSALNLTVLPPLTEQLMDVQTSADQLPSAHKQQQSGDDLNKGVLSRSYKFLGRVVKAAVPIQALMLLLLGVSSIVPLDQDELICSLQNNLQRSLEPMLQWSNGPPPI